MDPVTQKNIRELEMVQRRAACFVTGNYRTTSSVTRMLEALQWTELQQRRKRATVINHALSHCKPSCCGFTRTISYTEGCSTNNQRTRYQVPTTLLEDTKSPTIFFSISNPSMERITNCCRSCLHHGRIQGQPPDSCHILDVLVLIVYTTTDDGF